MAKDLVGKIERNLSALAQLIGEDNVEDVKKRIGNLIVDRIYDDLKSYDCYLFYPPDYKEIIEEAFESVQKKVTKMYKDAMLECANEAVQRFKDISISALDGSQGIVLRDCYKCSNKCNDMCKFYDEKYWIAHDTICAEEGFINYVEEVE